MMYASDTQGLLSVQPALQVHVKLHSGSARYLKQITQCISTIKINVLAVENFFSIIIRRAHYRYLKAVVTKLAWQK